MKSNALPLLLSIIAVALSAAAFMRAKPPPAPAPRDLARQQLSAPPEPTPGLVGECDGSRDAKDLQDLMKSSLNPCMSRLSFTIFHDQHEADERLDLVAKNATNLLECVRKAPTMMPADMEAARLPEYYRFLDALQSDALAVQVSSLEHDEAGVQHWFGHLKQDCVACHSRFRKLKPGDGG